MLQKGVYSYEYMNDWEKFSETSLPEKEDFYSYLIMEDITDAEYAHAKRVYKDLKIKKITRISCFVCWRRYIIVSWCIGELQKYVSWNI